MQPKRLRYEDLTIQERLDAKRTLTEHYADLILLQGQFDLLGTNRQEKLGMRELVDVVKEAEWLYEKREEAGRRFVELGATNDEAKREELVEVVGALNTYSETLENLLAEELIRVGYLAAQRMVYEARPCPEHGYHLTVDVGDKRGVLGLLVGAPFEVPKYVRVEPLFEAEWQAREEAKERTSYNQVLEKFFGGAGDTMLRDELRSILVPPPTRSKDPEWEKGRQEAIRKAAKVIADDIDYLIMSQTTAPKPETLSPVHDVYNLFSAAGIGRLDKVDFGMNMLLPTIEDVDRIVKETKEKVREVGIRLFPVEDDTQVEIATVTPPSDSVEADNQVKRFVSRLTGIDVSIMRSTGGRIFIPKAMHEAMMPRPHVVISRPSKEVPLKLTLPEGYDLEKLKNVFRNMDIDKDWPLHLFVSNDDVKPKSLFERLPAGIIGSQNEVRTLGVMSLRHTEPETLEVYDFDADSLHFGADGFRHLSQEAMDVTCKIKVAGVQTSMTQEHAMRLALKAHWVLFKDGFWRQSGNTMTQYKDAFSLVEFEGVGQ